MDRSKIPWGKLVITSVELEHCFYNIIINFRLHYQSAAVPRFYFSIKSCRFEFYLVQNLEVWNFVFHCQLLIPYAVTLWSYIVLEFITKFARTWPIQIKFYIVPFQKLYNPNQFKCWNMMPNTLSWLLLVFCISLSCKSYNYVNFDSANKINLYS